MKLTIGTILVIAGGLMIVPAAFAHHGSAIYDNGKAVTVTGTVTEWTWSNPHCLLEFDVKDDKGGSVHWVAEVSNPPDMTARGWSRKMFMPGDEVAVTMFVAKNGQPIGRIARVVVNGKTYTSVGQPPPPADGAGKQ